MWNCNFDFTLENCKVEIGISVFGFQIARLKLKLFLKLQLLKKQIL